MKDHYTAAELAELQLPGLPSTESATIRRAKREAWPGQKRAGRGGGWEYPLSALPRQARDALLAREAAAPVKAETAEVPAETTSGLPYLTDQ
jgi:putative transposase